MANPLKRDGRTTPHPTATVRARLEPCHNPVHFSIGPSRVPVDVRHELAPQPPPVSEAFNIGRDPGHVGDVATAASSTLSIAEWLGVMDWPFKLIKVPGAMRVPIAPHQGMNPATERVNIDMPPQTSLGALTSIKAPTNWAPEYAKLGVW